MESIINYNLEDFNDENLSIDLNRSINCYICLSTKNVLENELISPCKCSGTLKYVHQNCLQHWVDIQLKKKHSKPYCCIQCNTQYHFSMPSSNSIVRFLETWDQTITDISPFVFLLVCLGSVYWVSFSFGTFVIMQIEGSKKGLLLLRNSDNITFFLKIPSIPLGLMAGKLFNWENIYLYFWRKQSFFLFNYLFFKPPKITNKQNLKILLKDYPIFDISSVPRYFCSVLALPTISNVVGNYFFKSVESDLKRTLLGGFTFIIVKGLIKIYLRQNLFIRASKRKFINLEDKID